MRIFIQEYASGGGFSKHNLPPDFILEGFGMLRTLIDNFSRLNFEIVTTLDCRLKRISNFINTKSINFVTANEDFLLKSLELLTDCDYFLIIAPSTDNTLCELVGKYEKTAKSLNCQKDTIDFLVKKDNLVNIFSNDSFNYPTSYLFKDGYIINLKERQLINTTEEIISQEKLDFPLIWKPNIGDACENLSVVYDKNELELLIKQQTKNPFLLQEFIAGENLSATVFINNSKISVLSINKQIIDLNFGVSKYSGGITNINTPLKQEIENKIVNLISKIKGLNGLIGIDFIISKKNNEYKVHLIEINPRATTPICGILNKFNPPIDFTSKGTLTNLESNQSCYFSKKEIASSIKINSEKYQKLKDEYSIITPPILHQSENHSLLFRGFGENEFLAEKDFKEKFQNLLERITL